MLALVNVGDSPWPLGSTSNLTPVKHAKEKGQTSQKRQQQKRTPEATHDDLENTMTEPFEQAEYTLDLVDDGRSDSSLMNVTVNPNDKDDNDYKRYIDLVHADCQAFYQISRTVYVVQGWDKQRDTMVSTKYHVHLLWCWTGN